MRRIHKLPFIFGCLAAIAAGIVNYMTGAESQTIYVSMAMMMVIFFIIGMYVKNTILTIGKEVQEKKIAEEQKLRQQMEEQKASAAAAKQQQLQRGQSSVNPGQPNIAAHKLDLVAGDTEDDFQPLELSKAIRSKVKE